MGTLKRIKEQLFCEIVSYPDLSDYMKAAHLRSLESERKKSSAISVSLLRVASDVNASANSRGELTNCTESSPLRALRLKDVLSKNTIDFIPAR